MLGKDFKRFPVKVMSKLKKDLNRIPSRPQRGKQTSEMKPSAKMDEKNQK